MHIHVSITAFFRARCQFPKVLPSEKYVQGKKLNRIDILNFYDLTLVFLLMEENERNFPK